MVPLVSSQMDVVKIMLVRMIMVVMVMTMMMVVMVMKKRDLWGGTQEGKF